jgi:5'-phosphate synthase pdxT subunit
LNKLPSKKIGVLALQGGFSEHVQLLKSLGCAVREVRTVEDTKGLDALVLPGGESTTLLKLMGTTGLDKWAKKTKLPMMATCAGLIVLAKLGRLDVEIERNAYGSQLDSFEAPLKLKTGSFLGVFIRAPKIGRTGKMVEVLAKYDSPVLVRQGNILGLTFHPELTKDSRIHELFLDMLD